MNVRPKTPMLQVRNRRTLIITAASAALALVAVHQQPASAASGSWTGAALDGQWVTPGNWDTVPGRADGTFNSLDIATFGDTTNGTSVAVDLNRNVLGITFNTSIGGNAFNIGTLGSSGGNTLYLTGGLAGSVTQVASNTLTATNPIIQSPIVIVGNSYKFLSNATNATSGLKLAGGLTSSVTGLTTITLDGTNSASSTTSNSQVLGPITETVGGSTISVVKDGTGVWELRPAFGDNTYSGDTVINGGVLRLMSVTGAMSPNSNYIVNNGGTLRPNFTGMTGKSVKVNSGGSFQASADAVITNLNNTTGPSIWFNFTTTSGAFTSGANVVFTGTTPGQGGFRLSLSDAAGKISYSKGIDLGTVSRPFEIAQSQTNVGVDDPDLQVNGIVAGNGGGIVKSGPGSLKLNNAANSFTGTLEVQEGVVRFNSDNALTGTPPLVVSGGTFNVQGFTQTVGAVQLNRGTIAASGGTGAVASTSFLLNVANGDTAQSNAILKDSTASASLTKTGGGTGILTASNTYSGSTNVNAGTLRIATTGAINGGTLNVSGTGIAWINAGRPDALRVAAVTAGGSGFVDMNDNDLAVTNGTYAGVTGLIKTARNGGAWNGPNGITSSVAKNAVPKNKTLGTLTGTQYLSTGTTTFSGLNVAASDTLVKFTYYGDTDFNGKVNFDDYARVDSGFQTGGSQWFRGDFDYNGVVNFDDYALIDLAFNTQGTTVLRAAQFLSGDNRDTSDMTGPELGMVLNHFNQFGDAYGSAFLNAVPEPTSAALLLLGVQASACTLGRRSRRRRAH